MKKLVKRKLAYALIAVMMIPTAGGGASQRPGSR